MMTTFPPRNWYRQGLFIWTWFFIVLGIFACATGSPQIGQPVTFQVYEQNIAVLLNEGRSLQLYQQDSLKYLRSIALPAKATGFTLHGHQAYITTDEPAGRILVYDLRSGNLQQEISIGHTPMSPVLLEQPKLLCVACRFDNTVAVIDLKTQKIERVPVIREPIALVVTPPPYHLYVANHLPKVYPFDDEDFPVITAEITVIDLVQRKVKRQIPLPNGSHSLRDIALSPDGRYGVVSHIKSNFTVPPFKLERGQMNLNVISIIDTKTEQLLETVSLDDPNLGTANPWATAFSGDGKKLLVTHTGTQELNVIDFPQLLVRIKNPARQRQRPGHGYDNLLKGIRQRIPLKSQGPRCIQVVKQKAYIGGYFSDTLETVSWEQPQAPPHVVTLNGYGLQTQARLGEHYFNDAQLCLETWQSCASCHPDGRRDVMYWDLSNDGLGTFKDTKSLLMSTRTPPVMWRGVRTDAMTAIRAGIHHIQFAQPQPGQAEAIAVYLDAMPVTPSPYLVPLPLEPSRDDDARCDKCHTPGISRGQLSEAAQRGKKIFEGKAGCIQCHPHPLFTNLEKRNPGLGSDILYDVPSLIEVWRTAPYLHNGDALTIKEAITDYNWQQRRGNTKDLSEQELADLILYIKSL